MAVSKETLDKYFSDEELESGGYSGDPDDWSSDQYTWLQDLYLKRNPDMREPERPDRVSVYDPATMSLSPWAKATLDKIQVDKRGMDKFRQEALRDGPSAWSGLARQEQQMMALAARERAAQESAGQSAQARSTLAMRGGIDSGARERIARSGMRNFMDLSQNIGREQAMNDLKIGMTDEENRIKMLGALPGMENQAIQPDLEKAKMLGQAKQFDIGNQMKEYDSQNNWNMDYYKEKMGKWGAEKQAQATENSGGGGCCFIFLEARYGNGTMDEVVRRFRDEHMTDRNRRGYYKLSEVLVPLMRKSKLVKLAVRALMTDPMVAYGKAYYGKGSRLGKLFKPVADFWIKTFDYLGGEHPFIRENGEVV